MLVSFIAPKNVEKVKPTFPLVFLYRSCSRFTTHLPTYGGLCRDASSPKSDVSLCCAADFRWQVIGKSDKCCLRILITVLIFLVNSIYTILTYAALICGGKYLAFQTNVVCDALIPDILCQVNLYHCHVCSPDFRWQVVGNSRKCCLCALIADFLCHVLITDVVCQYNLHQCHVCLH